MTTLTEPTASEMFASRLAEQTIAENNCKLQDDVAAMVSSHRSDWSWEDVLSDVRKLKAALEHHINDCGKCGCGHDEGKSH
jgi:hypothetical protein